MKMNQKQNLGNHTKPGREEKLNDRRSWNRTTKHG